MKKKAKKVKLAKGSLNGGKWKAYGGPWDQQAVYFPKGGTMVFRIGPFHGYYTGLGEWKDVGRT